MLNHFSVVQITGDAAPSPDLTEQGAGFGEQLSEAAVEDAGQVLSQLQVLDLILADGDVGGPEGWNEQNWTYVTLLDGGGDPPRSAK